MVHQVSILVDDSDRGHEVAAVDGVHDCAHDDKSFSLWDDVFFDQSSGFVFDFSSARFVDLEVACVDERLVS